jgi:hypothetical protein
MNGLDGQSFTTINQSSTTPSLFTMSAAPAQVGQSAFLSYDPSGGNLTIGDGLAGGVAVRNGLQVRDEFVIPDPTAGINLTMTQPLMGQIAMSSATGLLALGASSLNPNIITLTQTSTAAGTGVCSIGNGGSSITMTGGAGGSQTSVVTTSATGVGSLLLGASAVNDRAIFINDTGGGANSAVVDITGGTATGVALRLRGYGAGSAAIISTNAGAGGVLNIQNNVTEASPNMVMTDASTTLNGLVLVPNDLSFVGSGSITAFQTFLTSGVSCGDNTTSGIPNPSGLAIGLYMVLARGTIGGVSSVACSVSTISYWDGSSWKWGGGGAAPALVTAPPSYVGIQGGGATLILANGGGLGTVTMDFTYLKLGGNLGI